MVPGIRAPGSPVPHCQPGSLLQIQLGVRLSFCHELTANRTGVEDDVVIRAAMVGPLKTQVRGIAVPGVTADAGLPNRWPWAQ